MDLGHWVLADNIEMKELPFGFIYEITNTANNKKYIGKKQCISKIKKAPLKGRKNKRITVKESDWRTYTSSSNELNEDLVRFGKDKFIFKILKLCGSKWELGYLEIKEQIDREVILRDDYYNGILNVRIGRPPKTLLN